MNRTIVIAFSTVDGIIEDPDGRDGTPNGGWAFRHGPEAVAGDKFKLGPILESGVLLMGRKTWQQFSHLWPARTDDFSAAMNRIPKLVVSHSITDLSAWENSSLLSGDLLAAVAKQKTRARCRRHWQRQRRAQARRTETWSTSTASWCSLTWSAEAPGCSPPRRLPPGYDRSLPRLPVRLFLCATSVRSFDVDNGKVPRVWAALKIPPSSSGTSFQGSSCRPGAGMPSAKHHGGARRRPVRGRPLGTCPNQSPGRFGQPLVLCRASGRARGPSPPSYG